jgi:hypothetical protein
LSALDTSKLINGLVPDTDILHELLKNHVTEQLSDFVACPWSEDQGGDLDGDLDGDHISSDPCIDHLGG